MNATMYRIFIVPSLIVLGLGSFGIATYLGTPAPIANLILFATIGIGSIDLVIETINALRRRHFALDYIALAAITTGLIAGDYLVTAIIVLMLAGGTTLEHYASIRARATLSLLKNRIPHHVLRVTKKTEESIPIEQAHIGDTVKVRTGEVVPLDGILLSNEAFIDESTLTGEPYSVEKRAGSHVKSGTINLGPVISLQVEKIDADSTYRHIVSLVEQAEHEKSPLVRLADRYSIIFALVTAMIALAAYALSGSGERILAVLVMATPCPLLLATPIALLGGVNAALKKQIIIKQVASLEILNKASALVFDKTGTLTLGAPTVTSITVHTKRYTRKDILAFARALEQNSLHPFAKAVVRLAEEEKSKLLSATSAEERAGEGISGSIDGRSFRLSRANNSKGMAADLFEKEELLATFLFEDVLKPGTAAVIEQLQKQSLALTLCTGDTAAAAIRVASQLGGQVTVKANSSPEDKQTIIKQLKQTGKTVVMVGDGINDAPALAQADLGMVFSHSEQTAASEAADVVFLGGNVEAVVDSILIAKRTIRIAITSILIGMGLSVIGMILAAFGEIPPLVGALLQEGIDVAVILYALRASR
jgi:heavy metal translocating P-type ATPase